MAKLIGKKNLTIQDRLAAHNAAAQAAVASFEKAANDLEDAAYELRVASSDAHQEADALRSLALQADKAAEHNEASARKIRSLFS